MQNTPGLATTPNSLFQPGALNTNTMISQATPNAVNLFQPGGNPQTGPATSLFTQAPASRPGFPAATTPQANPLFPNQSTGMPSATPGFGVTQQPTSLFAATQPAVAPAPNASFQMPNYPFTSASSAYADPHGLADLFPRGIPEKIRNHECKCSNESIIDKIRKQERASTAQSSTYRPEDLWVAPKPQEKTTRPIYTASFEKRDLKFFQVNEDFANYKFTPVKISANGSSKVYRQVSSDIEISLNVYDPEMSRFTAVLHKSAGLNDIR